MFEQIIEEADYVVANSKSVTIHYDKIDPLFEELKQFQHKHYLLNNPFGMMDLTIEQQVNFLLIYDSIIFSFWGNPKWSIVVENELFDGSYALLYCLLTMFKEHEAVFQWIQTASDDELRNIFKGTVEIPLLQERISILKNISQIVMEQMGGNFYLAVKEKQTDTELFAYLISNFPNLEDERFYLNHSIPFYKLGQLLTSDILHLREYSEKKPMIYSNLVGCADYKIPQVLNNLGILEYSHELINHILEKKELPENHEWEVEIRASMLVVIDDIYQKLGATIPRIDINDFLWSKGTMKQKTDHPYHLTRTTNY